MAEGDAEKTSLHGWSKPVARALSVLLALAALGWAADVYRKLNIVLINEQFNAVILAIAIAIVFLTVRAREGTSGPPPWYDVLAALAGAAAALYVAWDYRGLDAQAARWPLHGIVIGGLLLALVFEGLRRVAGKVLTIILAVFILYGLTGHLVPGSLQGRHVDPRELLLYLSLDSDGVFGSVFGVACTVVVAFLFFGALLTRSGGSEFFTNLSIACMGNLRGAGAKIAIVASAFFGTISGNAVSNVVTTGTISIPLMKSSGYKPEHAGAIEAVASTGGQLMPPVMGAAAFIMAELLAVPYSAIVLAALIPALLYYFALFVQADFEAAKGGFTSVPKEERPSAGEVLRAGWFFPIPFAVIVYALFWGNQSPETAALWASLALLACAVFFGYGGKRMPLRDAWEALVDTGRASLEILMIAAAAGFIIGILNVTGLNFALTSALVKIGAGNLPLLLFLAALISIILGMGMPTVGVYVLLAALVAPALVEAGLSPISAHLFVMYFGMMSMVTPPVAVAAYAAASIANADSMKTGLAGVKFGWSAYIVPFLFVASPNLLLEGKPFDIALAIATAVLGIYLIAAGVAGFMTRHLDWIKRLALVASGFALMIPANAFPGAIYTDIAGAVIGIGIAAWEIIASRRAKAALAPAG